MTDCKWAGTDRPRVLSGRHLDECEGGECRGCLPCTTPHCRVDHTIHVETWHDTCPACRDEARTNLTEIIRMCRALPEEVEHRGVNGEAMNLLGPVADPEAWGHRQASAAVGRIDRAWLEEATDERHPLLVLGTWLMAWQDALEHEDASPVTVDSAARYLDTQLTYMAGYEHVPFEDFARDLRGCVSHMENVLCDGVRSERTRVTCTNEACKRRPQLERSYGDKAADDRWTCPSCGTRYDEQDYIEAHAKQLRHAGSERYVLQVEAIATLEVQGRSRRTVRKWLAPDEDKAEAVVAGYCEVATHRVWLWWPDLWALHLVTPTRNRSTAA